MGFDNPRLRREAKTLTAMVGLYCYGNHGAPGYRGTQRDHLCADCGDLLAYALSCLRRCPYGAAKPTCANCPIHCYRPDRRDQIRAVMRYAGPRMLLRHPVLAVRHVLDGFRKAVRG